MKAKTARRWLARNKWLLARDRSDWPHSERGREMLKQYYLCLSVTNPLFRRFGR